MKLTKYILAIILIVVFFGGAIIFFSLQKNQTTPDNTSASTPSTTEKYSMADVSAHSTTQDCWSVIESKVYNLTDFINQHPGGSRAIIAVCGKDGTQSFNRMPSTVIPAARAGIAKYQIGVLAQ